MQKQQKRTVVIDHGWRVGFPGVGEFAFEEEGMLGSLYRVDDSVYIATFDNFVDGKKYLNTLKLGGGYLSHVRIGDVHTRARFVLYEWSTMEIYYQGKAILASVFTERLEYAMTGEGGIIELAYHMRSGEDGAPRLGKVETEFFIR